VLVASKEQRQSMRQQAKMDEDDFAQKLGFDIFDSATKERSGKLH